MKIAHIVCSFPPYRGGMGNSVYSYAKVLAERGHDITVITPDYGGEEEIKKEGFGLMRLKPFFKYGNAALLPQILFRLDPYEVVHLHYPFYGTAEFVILKKIFSKKKIKLIVHYHMDTIAGGVKGFIFKISRLFFLPLAVKYADRVICTSVDYIENSDVAELYEIYHDKFSAVPLGVDAEKFGKVRMPADGAGGNGGKKTILFVGGLDKAHYFKGLDILMLAFAKVIDNNKYNLSIVGNGDLLPQYEKTVDKLGLNGSVDFLTGVSDHDLPDYYQKADVVVLPSINKSEAFGLVLLEAMAAGKPVIASNIPGVRSVFKDGYEGLLARSGDADDLAAKLELILENGALAEKMGEAGEKTVRERYTWGKACDELELIYNSL